MVYAPSLHTFVFGPPLSLAGLRRILKSIVEHLRTDRIEPLFEGTLPTRAEGTGRKPFPRRDADARNRDEKTRTFSSWVAEKTRIEGRAVP